jgi:hypothetical protein
MADDPSTELDEAHMFEPHFDRHVWIYHENPNGVFAPLNPAVTCEAHGTRTHAKGHSSRSARRSAIATSGTRAAQTA